MTEQDCQQFQRWLTGVLNPFTVPILVATSNEVKPDDELANGSGCLISFEGGFGLLTCFHVWKYWQSLGKESAIVVLLGEGYVAVHLKQPKLVAWDEAKDIAIIDLKGVGDLGQKAWFNLVPENMHVPAQGDILVVLGFPGMWRESAQNQSSFSFGALPFVVTDLSPSSIVIAEQNNKDVFEHLDSQPRRTGLPDSCGGLSGAPAFFITSSQQIRLAGIVTHRGLGALFMARASLILDMLQKAESV